MRTAPSASAADYQNRDAVPMTTHHLYVPEQQAFAPMPFLPSSPTRLYTRRKSKHTSPLLSKTKKNTASTAEGKESVEMLTPKSTIVPAVAAEPATLPNEESSRRKSIGSFKGATVGRALDMDDSSRNGNHSGQTSRRSTTSTIDPDQQHTVVSVAAADKDRDNAGSIPGSIASASPTAPAQRSVMFDNASDSEYSIDEDVRPVVGRASSVRVGKPHIVQHKPINISKPHATSGVPSRSDSHSSLKAERMHGHRSGMLPSTPEEGALRSSVDSISSTAIRDFRELQPSRSSDSSATITPPLGASSKHARRTSSQDSTDTATAPPTGNTLHSIHPSIVNPVVSSEAEADVQQGEGVAPVPGINRAISSPFPLPGRGLSRRVTIRPADLIIKNHNASSSFRESVVTTPYPARMSIDASSMNFDESEESKEEEPKRGKEKERRKVSFSNLSSVASPRGAKDRFPSPERPEVLFIDLSLLSHPGARTTIEIQIADKGTFDDEHFFEQIRTAYFKQLLGAPRLAFTWVRRIGYVSITAPASYNAADFDSIDFVKHFQNPRLGRKRKAWVIWLRNNNPPSAAPTTIITHPEGAGVRQIDNLQRLSLRTRVPGHSRRSSWNKSHHTDRDANNVEENKRYSTLSEASSFNFVYSPAVPRLPFLPRSQAAQQPQTQSALSTPSAATASPCRSFFWPSNFSSSSASRSGNGEESEAVKIVTVSFHHEYRAGIIALLTLLVIVQAILASVIWIIFGVPGTRPGMDGEQKLVGDPQSSISTNWRIDARSRVLTGVVIGLVVLIMGGIVEGALVWGSSLLL
ncbi:hypothetical protein PMZ80_008843 [Knufia obscura]|uniref:Uncharacterized protein n=2 Tax=Knufia TaxID=430999 RepID=A0AAN8ENS1_9EURO|nr:hypothetical protein PMZ80_008843 [Knufia obscura]KAK5955197.1 hypothetical protein OHC33_003877 [Knufia fluminis]